MSASADDSTGVQAPGGLAPVTAGPIMGGNDRETERHRIPAMTPSPLDPSLPARPREFHRQLLLAGTPPNALLSLPDERILYLAAILRDTLVPAPALLLEEWQEFLDNLQPHGVYPLMAYRLRAWPAEVMAWLNRVFLFAAARAMRSGRQIQEVVDALEEAKIPSVLLKGPALARTVYLPCRVR